MPRLDLFLPFFMAYSTVLRAPTCPRQTTIHFQSWLPARLVQMVGILDLLWSTMTPVVLTIAQAAATSKVQPLELSSRVPYAQVASTNPALIWIPPLHAPLALEVTF